MREDISSKVHVSLRCMGTVLHSLAGDAGSGASNLRQYIIENDLLEAIIAMPEKDFYNTGIGTFIWVVTNRNEEHRKGYVQLIDRCNRHLKSPLRKEPRQRELLETSDTDL